MTAGVVVVLGPVGRNFGAGMSTGTAYVLDEVGTFASRCNSDMVGARLVEAEDDQLLLQLVREHAARPAGPRARAMLDAWDRSRRLFRKVVSHTPAAPAAS